MVDNLAKTKYIIQNMKRTREQKALIEQLALGLSETFTPFCEVVVHDLLDPKHAILAIHNNLSGREVGDPATEFGLARIADPEYPQVIANYANQFADGRQVKSTSIGIKDSTGHYVAALCMNVDLTLFRSLQNVLGQFGSIASEAPGGRRVRDGLPRHRRRIGSHLMRRLTRSSSSICQPLHVCGGDDV
jgi:predicted transcriptional regulator YheO